MSQEVPELQQLDAEQFSAENVDPFWFNEERHSIAMREVSEVIRIGKNTPQVFSGLHLNRDFQTKPAIVHIGGAQNDGRTRQQKYTAYQFGAANSEHEFISIDLPSHGQSDLLTHSQRLELALKQDVTKIADSQALAVADFLGKNREIIIEGDSLGAQVAATFAASAGRIGLKPILLVGFEMTGVNDFDVWQTSVKQFIKGNSRVGHSKYHEGKSNEKLDTGYADFKNELYKLGQYWIPYSAKTLWHRDPLLMISSLFRSPSASENGTEAIEDTLEEQEELAVCLVTGGLSKICNPNLMHPKFNELKQRYGSRFLWEVWPGDSHSMGIAEQQPRAAAYTRARIDQLSKRV